MACSICKRDGHDKRACPRVEGGRRGGQSKSEAKAEAARLNGQKGGREPKHRYFEIFETLDDVPGKPEDRPEWIQQIILTALRETVQGRGNKKLNDEIRLLSKAGNELQPRVSIFQAAKTLRKDRLKKKPKSKGPSTQKARPSEGPVR